MLKENNQQAVSYSDGLHRENFQGQDRMVMVKTVGYTGWKIVSVTPMTNFYQNFSQTRIMAVIIIIISILVMIFANQFVAVRVSMPLKSLEDSLRGIGVEQERLAEGAGEGIYIGGPPEIQHLGETIKSMVKQLRKLTDDIAVSYTHLTLPTNSLV